MEFGLNEILTIIDKVKTTNLSMFEYQDGDTKIKIQGTRQKEISMAGTPGAVNVLAQDAATGTAALSAPAQGLPQPSENYQESGKVITSPMVGTFYDSPSEGGEPFIHIGDTVKKGQTIGIVEAMKLMNEIESEYDGTVEEILVSNGQMVEYGQPLVRIREA